MKLTREREREEIGGERKTGEGGERESVCVCVEGRRERRKTVKP